MVYGGVDLLVVVLRRQDWVGGEQGGHKKGRRTWNFPRRRVKAGYLEEPGKRTRLLGQHIQCPPTLTHTTLTHRPHGGEGEKRQQATVLPSAAPKPRVSSPPSPPHPITKGSRSYQGTSHPPQPWRHRIPAPPPPSPRSSSSSSSSCWPPRRRSCSCPCAHPLPASPPPLPSSARPAAATTAAAATAAPASPTPKKRWRTRKRKRTKYPACTY